MSTIKVTLKDGTVREYPKGVTVQQVAEDISPGLARAAVGGEIDGEPVDYITPLEEDVELNLVKFEDDNGKIFLRHTGSHILAQAVKRLYPDAKLAIGPAIRDGFYYDIDTEHPFTPEDLEKIEAEMKKIIKEDLKVSRFELPRAEAI